MNIFRVFGFGLLLSFVFFGIYYGVLPDLRTAPVVPPGGVGFEGTLKIPESEFKEAIGYAVNRSVELNTDGRKYISIGSFLTWASFFCTSAITLVLGFFGRTAAQPGQAPDTAGLGQTSSRIVGLLAASAAVLTAAGSLVKDEGQSLFDASDKAVAAIARARADVDKAETATEQRDVLLELRRQMGRL